MKSKRSLRSFSNTLTAAGLALAVSACSTVYQDDWNQATDVPDLNQPAQRSQALLDYCKNLRSRGDLNLAAGICNRAHEINPTDPAPLIELARVLEELEMTASAEEAYRAALLLDPQQTNALYGLGKIYIDQRRYDMAVGPLEAAAEVQSDDPRIYNALGVIMDQQGQHADAQAYYKQGLAHSPRNVSLRNNLGLSMVLDGQPEAGLAMLRDVAAEPASGATAGHNLEMASQIAAQHILENPANSASAPETRDPRPQTGEVRQPPRDGGPWARQELSTLSPSSSVDETEAPASEPLPLLQSYSRQQSDSMPAAMPVSPTQDMQSLDHELADSIVQPPIDESETAALEAVESVPETAPTAEAPTPEAPIPSVAAIEPASEMAGEMAGETTRERPFEPTAPEQLAALPETDPVVDFEADPAAISEADPAADHKADPTTFAGSDIPRDWSLAAQTVFSKSRVAIPEPSQITAQERTAANDAFHATPAPEASSKMSSEPAMTVQASPHGDLTLALASTPKTASGSSAVSDGYPIDEDTFYTAQLASFLTAARARTGWQILRDSAGELLDHSDGYIVRADLGAELGTFYRVRTGMMDDRAAASQFCLDLQAVGLDCMPVEASMQETSEALVDKICQTGSTQVLCRTVQRPELAPRGAPHVKG
jgi:Flp pilus assembly protein TadD